MKEIINQIIDTEREAQQKGRLLEKREEEFKAQLEKELQAFQEEKREAARRRVQKVEQAEKQFTQEQLQIAEKKYGERMTKLETTFQQNRDYYLDVLFHEITGGEDHA